MNRWTTILFALIATFLLAADTSAPTATEVPKSTEKIRGMTISCHGNGRIWGSDLTVQTMANLKALGCNWVTIHPYAGINTNGQVSDPRTSRLYQDTTWLTRPIAEAKRLGLKIMIKPHLAYWGSGFSWRGEITFDSEEKWSRFFDSYENWVTYVAELSTGCDAFVVGTELDKTVQHEQQWRDIIKQIRTTLPDTPLTYSANWDSFRGVAFWDDLDVIGMQSYFPLVDMNSESGRIPTQQELDASWKRLDQQLTAYAEDWNKQIIFCELGFNRSADAARTPWDHRSGGPNAEEIQKRCMEASLRAVENSDTIIGAFLWKWFPGEDGLDTDQPQRRHRGNFLMSTPSMRTVIADHWGSRTAAR